MFENQQQTAMFHESINDALRELVVALGGTKAVGVSIRRELTADHAGRWLNDCLNGERREHLTPEQLLLLISDGRRAGLHSVMAWICAECGYATPVPVEPADERADLQRQYIDAARAMARLAERIERVNSPRAVA